jgi:hypothetical protein
MGSTVPIILLFTVQGALTHAHARTHARTHTHTQIHTRNTQCNAEHFTLISGKNNLILASLLNACPSDQMNNMILTSE